MKWSLFLGVYLATWAWGWDCPGDESVASVRWIKASMKKDVVLASCLDEKKKSMGGDVYIVDITSGNWEGDINVLMGMEAVVSFKVVEGGDEKFPKIIIEYIDSNIIHDKKGKHHIDTAFFVGNHYEMPHNFGFFISKDALDNRYFGTDYQRGEDFRTLADKNARSIDREAVKLFQQKKLDAALALLQTNAATLPLRSSTLPLFNDYGYFLEQANRSLEAIPVLEKVVAFAPERTPAYLNLGDAYAKAGETEKAKVNYRKYVDLMEKSGKGTKVPSRIRTFLKP